jgi:hypothetical protein
MVVCNWSSSFFPWVYKDNNGSQLPQDLLLAECGDTSVRLRIDLRLAASVCLTRAQILIQKLIHAGSIEFFR